MFLRVGEYALLRLHKEYSIQLTLGVIKKLTQQYVRPFQVLKKVDKLASRLHTPPNQKIYPVFSAAQLEPSPAPADNPFGRDFPRHPPPVFVDGDTDRAQSFEVKRLLNKCIFKKGRGIVIQYLVCWLGCGPKFDRWYSVKDLDNTTDLVKEYEASLPKA